MPPPADCTVTHSHGPAAAPDAHPWLFVVACGQRTVEPARYSLRGATRVTLGRGDEALAVEQAAGVTLHVRVPDPRMSSSHATLERVLGAWVLADAGSKNGTLVNGSPVRRATLADGDLVELGSTLLRYRELPARPGGATDVAFRAPAGAGPLATLLPSIAADMDRLRAVAPTRVPVLLRGEAGAGKAALAEAVHALSGRRGAFVAVPCGALAPALAQAELLGVRRGAFPGADGDREGLVARAHGGTLFLDEIGDLAPAAQAALLGVLRGGEARAVGADAPARVDLRVVAATRHDPDALVACGALRPELVASLAGFALHVPPLRDRREDLGLLLGAAAAGVRFQPAALRALFAHGWPRNRPEFEHCVASARALAGDGTVTVEHLPEALREAPPAPGPSPSAPPPAPAEAPPTLTLEGEYWTVSYQGSVARLRDGDGVRYLAYLIERSGVEVHALELATFARGARRGAAPAESHAGGADELEARDDEGAGPLLDAEARAAYRRRVEDLREVVEEATGWGDRGRAAKAQAELDALAGELARAVGLGGRERKAGTAAERARVAVTMRLRAAMKKLAEAHPRLGEHLEASVRTGTFCRYAPRGVSASPRPAR